MDQKEIIAYKVAHYQDKSSHQVMLNPHYHDSFEIYFFFGDIMQYFLGNRVFMLEKNDVVIVDRFTYHRTSYNMTKDQTRVNVTFGAEVFNEFMNKESQFELLDFIRTHQYISGQGLDIHDISMGLDHLVYLCQKKPSDVRSEQRKRLLLIDIIYTLMDKHKKNKEIGSNSNEKIEQIDDISKIVEYINDFFSDDISLVSLSERFGISRYHLCRKFKSTTGSSITEYVNNKRLTEAGKLLENTKYTITRIGELVGFNNTSYFIRLFKKMYAASPGEYRKSRF